MPRKTRVPGIRVPVRLPTSMRPRLDAAENLRVRVSVSSSPAALQ